MTTITTVKLARVALATDTIKNQAGTSLVTLSAGDLIMVASVEANTAPAMNVQQTTVTYRNSLNPNWARSIRSGSATVAVVRVGSYGVQWLSSVLVKLSCLLQKSLTWTPPVVVAQPDSLSVAHGAEAEAVFVASFGSELATTFAWSEGVTVDGVTTWTPITPGSGGFTDCAVTTDTTGLISTLTISGLTTTGKTGYNYRCAATDTATVPGTTVSTAATLTVT